MFTVPIFLVIHLNNWISIKVTQSNDSPMYVLAEKEKVPEFAGNTSLGVLLRCSFVSFCLAMKKLSRPIFPSRHTLSFPPYSTTIDIPGPTCPILDPLRTTLLVLIPHHQPHQTPSLPNCYQFVSQLCLQMFQRPVRSYRVARHRNNASS
jgi:hypothetical protein